MAAKTGATKELDTELDEEAGMAARFNRQVEEARRRVNDSMGTAKEKIGDLQSQAADVWDDAVDYIRENPGKVIAFSLGLGLAIGLLLRMRRGEMYIEEGE